MHYCSGWFSRPKVRWRLAQSKAGSGRRAKVTPVPAVEEAAAFVADIGQLVRLGRAKRGITRRKLAEESGISERYLAQIEGGQGNPSVIVLKAVAEAIDVPVIELLPRSSARAAALTKILDNLARIPLAELPAVATMIEGHLAEATASDRARRIALVGLRGAGKSTLGKRLAGHL